LDKVPIAASSTKTAIELYRWTIYSQ